MSTESLTPPPGTLYLRRHTPNPNGADETELFVLVGNPSQAVIHEIIPGEGVDFAALQDHKIISSFRLKILHFNDLHGHLSRFSAQGDDPVFSRIVSRLHELRAKCQGKREASVLALSAGDDLIGSVFDELLAEKRGDDAFHAAYRLYSAAGIDVGTIGNHDLDLGSGRLAYALDRDAHFPAISANLTGCPRLAEHYYPAALFVTKGVRVGVIGLTTPGQIRPFPDATLEITDPVQAVQNLLPAIRPLCDVVIILSHLGYSLRATNAAVRGAGDVELAKSLPPGSIHLIVGGHTHHVLNEDGLIPDNIVNGIPIVQAGSMGRFIGEVQITIEENLAAVTQARLTRTADFAPDEEFEREVVAPIIEHMEPLFSRSLGVVVDHPDLSTGFVGNSFSKGESALANFITDALVERCRVQGYDVPLAMLDASSVGCGLPIGEIKFSDWFSLMPFADTLFVCQMTGAELKALIEDNAYRVDRPGEPHTERGFLHFSSRVRYTIHLGASRKESRASDITVNGEPIEEHLEDTFGVACSSFCRERASSWQQHARQNLSLQLIDIQHHVREVTALFVRDELVAFLQQHGGVTEAGGVRRDGRCKIVPG